jgi:cytoskeletal protein CcmA (bactofilin family)
MFHRPKTEDQPRPAGSADPVATAEPVKTDVAVQPKEPVQASAPPSSGNYAQSSYTGGFRASSASPAAPVPASVKSEQTSEKETRAMTTPSNTDKPTEQGGEGYNRPLDIPGTAAFQRPGATGPQTPRVPTPGTYSAPGYSASPYGSSTTSTDARGSARRLVVGEGITMSGEIESCDTLIVEGTVEATLKGASILDIAESGMFYGTVEIDECTIAGRFEGDITVNGRLTLKASGSITGSITYKELAVEAGATIDGKMSPLNGAVKKGEKKEVKGGLRAPKLGQGGGELPFAGHATAAE